jgi:beta-mannosidase
LVKTLSLDGSWKYIFRDGAFHPARISGSGWKTMRLPSSWALDGAKTFDRKKALNHGGVAWFRRKFQVPAGWKGQNIVLRFEGVDYSCSVYVNGRKAVGHEGFFAPFHADVTRLLKPGEINTIAVRVDSPLQKGFGWRMEKTVVKGIFGHHDMRPGGEGPRGQEFGTGGIWGHVTLEAHENLWIERVNAEGFPGKGSARIELRSHVVNFGKAREAEVEVCVEGANFRSPRRVLLRRKMKIAAGDGRIRQTLSMPAPRLWEVWERGFPHLYRLTLTIRVPGSAPVQAATRFGVREVRMDRQWRVWLNGKRLYLRGTNYLPTQWLSEMDSARARRDCRMMREHNINCVRVHAHVTRKSFYPEADAAGLLVWQDFPLQWAYVDSPRLHKTALAQMREMVCLLRGHPSIFAWCVHNETPWVHGLIDRPQLRGMNQEMDHSLMKLAKKMDPERYCHLNSATGDTHVYYGWYEGKTDWYEEFDEAPLVTEYGAQALPNLPSVKKMMGPLARFPRTVDEARDWQFHCFQPHQTFTVARLPLGSSFGEFHRTSQSYQAKLLQFSTEKFRSMKWRGTTGLMQFCWVDPWPSVTWSVVDYWRIPKPGAHALKRAYEPVLPALVVPWRFMWGGAPSSGFTGKIFIVNDHPFPLKGATIRWDLGRKGRTILRGTRRVGVGTDASVETASLRLPPGLAGSYRLTATVSARNMKPVRNTVDLVFRD